MISRQLHLDPDVPTHAEGGGVGGSLDAEAIVAARALRPELTPAELVELAHVAVRGVWDHSPLDDIPSVTHLATFAAGGLGSGYYNSPVAAAFSREKNALGAEWASESERAKIETAGLESPESRTPEALEIRNSRLFRVLELCDKFSEFFRRFDAHFEELKTKFTTPDNLECIVEGQGHLARLQGICAAQKVLVQGKIEPVSLDAGSFSQLLSHSLEIRKQLHPVEVTTTCDLEAGDRFDAHPGLLMRAVIGAVTNATDAAKSLEFKDLKVEIGLRRIGDFVAISISDNLPGGFPEKGLAPDTEIPGRPRACSVFFSSKPRKQIEGAEPVLEGGVGLAEIYQIVELHGGTLEISNNQGAGSTTHIILPPAAPKAEA